MSVSDPVGTKNAAAHKRGAPVDERAAAAGVALPIAHKADDSPHIGEILEHTRRLFLSPLEFEVEMTFWPETLKFSTPAKGSGGNQQRPHSENA